MCLIRLKDRELITRLPLFRSSSGPFALPYPVNVLTAQGQKELIDYVNREGIHFIARPLVTRLPFRTLDHELAVRDVAVQFERACEEHGWSLLYWQGDEDFEDGKGRAYTGQMIPDGFFLVSNGTDYRSCFLEVDRGTETVASGSKGGLRTIKDWTTKMDRYRDYLPRYQRDALFRDLPTNPLLLTVTTSPARMTNLRRAAVEADCNPHALWFTTFAGIADWPTGILDRVWRSPRENSPRSLAHLIFSERLSENLSQRRKTRLPTHPVALTPLGPPSTDAPNELWPGPHRQGALQECA